MAAATFDSADCLLSFNQKAGRPTTDAITDALKYGRLTRSQNRVVAMLASVFPRALYPAVAYGSIPTCTTTDSQLFTFGTDANLYAVSPIGKVSLYANLQDYPDYPMRPGIDYEPAGTTGVRIPNNGTYTGTIYWVGITNPPDMDATHQPSLFPEASRELIVIDAVRQFATEGNRNPDLAAMMELEWSGGRDRPGAWPTWCGVWKTQYRQGGALQHWTGLQLALSGAH